MAGRVLVHGESLKLDYSQLRASTCASVRFYSLTLLPKGSVFFDTDAQVHPCASRTRLLHASQLGR